MASRLHAAVPLQPPPHRTTTTTLPPARVNLHYIPRCQQLTEHLHHRKSIFNGQSPPRTPHPSYKLKALVFHLKISIQPKLDADELRCLRFYHVWVYGKILICYLFLFFGGGGGPEPNQKLSHQTFERAKCDQFLPKATLKLFHLVIVLPNVGSK